MKKTTALTCLLLAAALLLAGCGGEQKTDTSAGTEQAALTLAEKVGKAAADAGDLAPLTEDDLSDVMGLEEGDYTEFVWLQSKDLDGREILVLRTADADGAKRAAGTAENYLGQQKKETRNYAPEAYKLLEEAKVTVKGNTVALVVGGNAAAETEAILAGE